MRKTFLFSLTLLMALFLCLPFAAFAAEGELTIRLESANESVQPGEEMTILLWVDQNPGFFQATLQLQYDPTAISFVGASLENSALNADVIVIDGEVSGTVTVNIGALPVEEGAEALAHTATGQILAVTFRIEEEYTGYITVTAGGSAEGGADTVTILDTNVTVRSQIPEPPATCEHTQQEQIPMQPATCTQPGWTEGVKCTECNEILVTPQYIVSNGHTPGPTVPENNVPPSCQSDGSYDEVVYCSICNEELSRETKVNASTGEHVFATEQTRLDATCTEGGYVIMACGCGEMQTETLPAAGHKEVVDAGIEATCTTDGLTEGIHCEVCDEILLAQEEILAKGHTEIVLSGYAATCDSHGLTDGMFCSECGIITVAQEQTPLAPHSEEWVPGKEATCTETGLTDGMVCAICAYVMTPQEEIPLVDHMEIAVEQVDPTCAAVGYTEGTRCEVCELIMSGCEELEKLEHTETVLQGIDPTCSTDGRSEGTYCTVCSYIIVEPTVIPSLDHTPQIIPGQESTCTETGWTEGSRCGVCNEVLEDSLVIPVLDHIIQTVAGRDATCSEVGLTDGESCTQCGTILQEQQEIPRLEHQYDHSCDADCNACHAPRVSLEHVFGSWFVTQQATEDAPGEQARTCENCGHRETRVLAMLPVETGNRGLIIGVAFVIMAGCVVAILVILRKVKIPTKTS